MVADLQGVGQNLQDHLLLPFFFRSKRPLPVPMFIAEAGLFVRTRPGMKSAGPDLQFHFGAGIPAFLPGDKEPNFAFVPILTRPMSRGLVTLRSADPLAAPVIQPNYLNCESDVRVLSFGMELSRRLAATAAMSEFNGGELAPGAGFAGAALHDHIRDHASTVWHPVGTCAMGGSSESVVDPQLRVHGLQGLRVADASVMPTITSGNTHATCLMIGEKSADLILHDNR